MKKIFFIAALAGAALMTACGNTAEKTVTMGSLSNFDSLSYALGSNIATSLDRQLQDVPFNYEVVEQAINESALGKTDMSHDKAVEKLQTFFMMQRPMRAQAIADKHAKADSIRLAEGDTTKVVYPQADADMFESEAERDSISYSLGNDIGYTMSQSGLPVQLVWINQAMADVRDNKSQMSEDAVNEYLQYYFRVKLPAQNAEASQQWLDKISKKSGVNKTESGLLYKVNKKGDASKIAKDPRDQVRVHYTGRTRNGKVFDTSIFANRSKEQKELMRKQNPDGFNDNGTPKQADEPIQFPLNGVIPGWTEGMMLVGEGGTITLWVPSDLAYGAQGAGRDIGPNDALEFEVDVIEVIPYTEPATAAPAQNETSTEPAPSK